MNDLNSRVDSLIQTLRGNASDLHDISASSAADLVDRLSDADLVYAFYPAGDFTMLKGDALLRSIHRNGEGRQPTMMAVRVANTPQCGVVAAALELIEKREMGPLQIKTFADMLVSMQDGTDA